MTTVGAWVTPDTLGDPHEAEHRGDPAELVDAAGFLMELAYRPAWHARAACRGVGPAGFFPARSAAGVQAAQEARRLCATCPVTADCAEVGATQPDGIWAGEPASSLRRARRSVA